MRTKQNVTFLVSILFVSVILSSLLWHREFRGNEGESTTCGALVQEKETKSIVALGTFHAYSESFVYLGEVVEFEVRVIFQPDIEVKDRSLINLDLAPYEQRSQSEVRTVHHSECSEKVITFEIQALDVHVGTKNIFEYRAKDGGIFHPTVEYVKDGLLKEIQPRYEAPFVLALTDGKVDRVLHIPKHSIPYEEEDGARWFYSLHFYIGILLIWIALMFAGTRLWTWRIMQAESAARSAIHLPEMFPELFEQGDSHDRLARAYFRLETLIEGIEDGVLHARLDAFMSDNDKISLVFSAHLDEEKAAEILEELHIILEQNIDSIGDAYRIALSEEVERSRKIRALSEEVDRSDGDLWQVREA